MKFSVQPFVRITALLFILALVVWHSFSRLTLTQEPPTFDISLTPQTDQAVSGQPFTYTLAITNMGRSPSKEIVVRAKTPAGSVLVDTYFSNRNWLVGGVQRGQAAEVIWVPQQPVAPGEVVTFELVVNIAPELAGQPLISAEYAVITRDTGQPLASGPPVTTQVVAPTPTPSPVAPETDTPAPIAPASPTLQPEANSTFIARAAVTPASQANVTIAATVTSAPVVVSQNTVSASPPENILPMLGLAGLALVVIGLIWFWKRR